MTLVVVEWTWTLIAALGVVVSGGSLIQAWGDKRSLLARNYNGRRRLIATGHLRREGLRTVVQGLGLYVGLFALSSPNPPGARISFPTLCLVAMQAIIVLSTFLDHRMRTRLLDYWKNVDRSHVSERDKELER